MISDEPDNLNWENELIINLTMIFPDYDKNHIVYLLNTDCEYLCYLKGIIMNEIALVADRDTVTCFKLAGLNNVFSVNSNKEAEECIFGLMEKNSTKIVLITERFLNKIKIIEKFSEPNSPLVIPIPDFNGPKVPKNGFLASLIYRKTGIEVKF